MMENPDQNSDYALRAIQEPRLRETEEFNQWIMQVGAKCDAVVESLNETLKK